MTGSSLRRLVECAVFAILTACVGSGMRTRGANPATRTALREDPVASAPQAVSGPDAALRCDLVARIAARAGWSRDDRRRDAVAAWFDLWSAATHRRFAIEQDALRGRLGRDFEADDAAAIARVVPLYAWDEASGSLRRVDADGRPFAADDARAVFCASR